MNKVDSDQEKCLMSTLGLHMYVHTNASTLTYTHVNMNADTHTHDSHKNALKSNISKSNFNVQINPSN